MKVTSHGANEPSFAVIENTGFDQVVAACFNNDERVVPTSIRCFYCSSYRDTLFVRMKVEIGGHTSSEIEFKTPRVQNLSSDTIFYAMYRHQVIQGLCHMTREQVLPLLLSCLRPTFDQFWSCIEMDVMTRRNRKLTSTESFKMGVLTSLSAVKDPNDSQRATIKRLGEVVREIIQSTWFYDMIHFRILDECTPSLLLQYKQEYRQFLFCERDDNEGDLYHGWRKDYYLGNTESHFRNVLFKLFGHEIQLIMSLSGEWIIPDLTTRLIIDYITVLIYPLN